MGNRACAAARTRSRLNTPQTTQQCGGVAVADVYDVVRGRGRGLTLLWIILITVGTKSCIMASYFEPHTGGKVHLRDEVIYMLVKRKQHTNL